MRTTAKVFLVLGTLFLFAGGYFAAGFVWSPNIGELVVIPIYVGFSVIAALMCFAIAIVSYLLRKKHQTSVNSTVER
jgi:hypothetical protein